MTRPRRFDLIAFDWDGTLFDSTAFIAGCIQQACGDLGVRVPSAADAAYVIGLGLHDALRYAVPELEPARYAEIGRRYRHHYLVRQHELVLFDGTLEMLRALKRRNHWLALATGKSRRGLDEALATVQLHGLLDGSRTADETAAKPSPQMLLELMHEFGAEPERTLMVGDTTHDLQMARNAGVECAGVSFGAHDAAAFDEFTPLVVVHSTRELHDWLVQHA